MFVRSWKCDLCHQSVSDQDVACMSGGATIKIPGSSMEIRLAGLRVKKGEEEIRDVCPTCRAHITKCILEGKPWSASTVLPPSQRSLLLHTSSGA